MEGGTVLYLTDFLNLRTAGSPHHDRTNLLDALRPRVAGRNVALLVEATPEDYDLLQRTPECRAKKFRPGGVSTRSRAGSR